MRMPRIRWADTLARTFGLLQKSVVAALRLDDHVLAVGMRLRPLKREEETA